MVRPNEWRIHIGAHKTATTHFQETLGLYRSELFESGIDYIPHHLVRSANVSNIIRPHQRIPFRGFVGRWAFERTLNPLVQGLPVVALSEENLIGGSQGLLTNRLYADTSNRLSLLEAVARVSKVTVFLSVRRYDEILPSAYVQTLKDRSPRNGKKPSFESIRVQALTSPPSWFDLVTRLKQAFPSANLRIWRFEDYLRHEARVIAAFCGTKLSHDESLAIPKGTRTPSAEAVAELESLDPALPADERKSIVQRIQNGTDGKTKFEPFSSEERQRLGEAYMKDIETIDSAFPGVILNF